MKKEIQANMLKAFTLLLTTVCLLACFTDAEAQEDIIDYSKYGEKGAAARKEWLLIPEQEYDPNTKAYCDALWMRVHEEDCPMLVLKDRKKVITLEQADKEGWRIGESGQSGRDRCCFKGYRRKYPEADIPEDANGIAQEMGSGKIKWHYAGCHRFTVSPEHLAMTPIEAEAWGAQLEGYYMCEHCIERGPSLTTADMETLRARPAPPTFTPPAGWTPEPFSPDKLPSKEEIDILIQQTLANGYAIQEAPYTDPIASLEEFMGRRFFFPVGEWLHLYQAYRSTGDKRLLDALRVSARHYTRLCVDYPDVAQLKARDPEHMAFIYSMAVSSRITLQLALKRPDEVSPEELSEAIEILNAIVSTLKPVLEGNDSLDPVMGIPQEIADDFRSRAFNRALNGIGTIGMATAALEDLQALNSTTEYQPTIDRYRKVIREYIKNWKNTGFEETYEGDDYFSYPYSATDNGRMQGDVKLFGADDQGHFTHALQGAYLLYESVPELGIDDPFMTAIANTIHFNSYTTSGSPQTPSQEAIRPYSRYPFGAPRERFYLLEAFNNGVIEGQCSKLSEEKKAAVNSSYDYRLKILHAQYMKALRMHPSIICLCITVPAQTTFALDKNKICVTDTVQVSFTGLGTETSIINWGFDGGDVLSGPGQGAHEVNWSTGGSKTISMVVEENGCTSIITDTLYVYQPIADFSMDEVVCGHQNTQINFTGAASDSATYNWDFNSANIISGIESGPFELHWENFGEKTIKLTINDNGCISNTALDTIKLKQIPTPDFSTPGIVCHEGTANIAYTGTASDSAEFIWSFDGGSIKSGINEGPYEVYWDNAGLKTIYLYVEEDGCSAYSSSTILVNEQTNPINICMVSVDSSNHNLILWDQLNDALYDSVFIYKESSQSDFYKKIGSVSALDTSLFSDVESNPAQNASRYKISALDTCGFETDLSNYHKTLYLTISLGTNGTRILNWDSYEGFDYSTIHIYRGNSKKDLVKIAEQASNTFTYTDPDHSGNKNYYQIEIFNPFPCSVNSSSSKKYAGTGNYESTKSNIVSSEELTSLALIEKSNFEIYPNPATNALYVKTNGGNEIKISILSTDGKVIKSNRYQNENIEIDISDLNTGIYILRFENQDNLISKKFVKN
jgi:hypothetical protein